MRYKDKTLGFNAVVRRMGIGLLFLALVSIAGLLVILVLALCLVALMVGFEYLMITVIPFVIEYPVVLGVIPVGLGLLFLTFVLGDKLIELDEIAERNQKKRALDL